MATTYSIAPSPKWYFADAQGRPAAGGTMETFSSIDHSTPKMIYSDAFGLHPYANPMDLDASGGTKVQMFWQFNEIDLYYVVVKDASGNIICTADNFPAIGGGGVTPITANVDIENNLVNGQFLFIDAATDAASLVTTIPQGETHLAPGSGFFKNTSGQYVPFITAGTSSGWSFFKAGGVGATDNIKFEPVLDMGAGYPLAPSANATRFFTFTLSGLGTAFTEASLRDVIPNVEMFSGETLTISFDCHGSSAAGAELQVVQYFGTGGTPSADVVTPAAFTFNNSTWSGRKILSLTVPSVVGKSKGTDLNDCIIVRIMFPLNTIGIFSVTNLQIQRGTFGLAPYIEQTYAQDQYKVLIDLIHNGSFLFKTGDYIFSDNVAVRNGWFNINSDGQHIGKTAASGAGHYGLEYQSLYILWWTIFSNTRCIVNTGRGASALADFNADKMMTVPQSTVGSVFAVATLSGATTFGVFEGERTHALTAAENGPHTHLTNASLVLFPAITEGGAESAISRSLGGVTGSSGLGTPHNNMQPTTYKYLFVKL